MQKLFPLGIFILPVLFFNTCPIVLADDCVGKLEVPFSFRGCESIQLPDFTIRFNGTSQPDPDVKLLCWNYEVTSKKSRTNFSHCHTGEIGASKEFSFEGLPYIADMDVPICNAGTTAGGSMAIWKGWTATHPEYRAKLYDSWAKSCADRHNKMRDAGATK